MPVIVDSSDNPVRCCNTKCHQAYGSRCVCICDGRYHGCALGTNIVPRDTGEAGQMHNGELLEGHQYDLGFIYQYELELTGG